LPKPELDPVVQTGFSLGDAKYYVILAKTGITTTV
jgi:hypothetical protein